VLRILEINRSTYYHSIKPKPEARPNRGGRPKSVHSVTADGKKVSNEQIKEWICELIQEEEEGDCYGYVKITHALRRNHDLVINKKKVYRLCKELGLLRPQRKIAVRHPRRIARNRVVTASNQVWEIDYSVFCVIPTFRCGM